MRGASNNPTPVLTARLDSLDDGLETGTTRKMASVLYYVLAGLVDGPAYVLVDQVEDSNGLEAWRLLYQRYARTNIQNAIMTLVTLVNTKLDDKDFETKFSKWESDITKFERAIEKPLYDEVKVGLLIAGTSGKLHDHLCLTTTTTIKYEDIRNVILSYLKTRSLSTSTKTNRDSGPVPMEIDNINFRKGKGQGKSKDYPWRKGDGKKGKGTSSWTSTAWMTSRTPGKGKGNTKTSPSTASSSTPSGQKFCSRRRTNTHNTNECWYTGAKGVRATYDESQY